MTPPVRATIDLRAISDNLAAMRAHLGGLPLLAAVKANAYGHGAVEVSRHLQESGAAEQLGVATVAEGIQLRQAGITLPILKLSHCLTDELDQAIGAGLALTAVDESTLRACSRAATALGREVAVHLKLDSGMGRIGAPLDQGVALASLAQRLPGVDLVGVFTHLPVADAGDDQGYTAAELRAFGQVSDAIMAEVGPLPWVHAANSGAILGHDLTGHTLARPGIAMYGYYPDQTTPRTVPLRQALQLSTRVSFIKDVAAGTSIGYGRTWTAEHPTRIATLPIGYADGFSRLNSNRGQVLVNGRRVPVVGRVCMDQTMIDLGTDGDDAVGDEVTVLGGDPARGDEGFIGTDEVADLMGTISYEVTCLIAARVPRHYLG